MGEALSLHAIIAHWLERVVVPNGVLPLQVNCYRMLSLLISLMSATARGNVRANDLSNAIRLFLESHLAAWPATTSVPKHHFMIHFPRWLDKIGWCPNVIALERKHKSVKRFADAISNTSAGFDKSILQEVTAKHMHDLETASHLDLSVGLREPRVPPKNVHAWLCSEFGNGLHYQFSRCARVSEWERIFAGDIVAIKPDDAELYVGRVCFFCSVDTDMCFTLVSGFDCVERHDGYSVWTLSDTPCVVWLNEIRCALTYSLDGNTCVVLHPYGLM
jgi:hypothetical protein